MMEGIVLRFECGRVEREMSLLEYAVVYCCAAPQEARFCWLVLPMIPLRRLSFRGLLFCWPQSSLVSVFYLRDEAFAIHR